MKKPERLELKDVCGDNLELEANEFGQVYIEASEFDIVDIVELAFNDPAKVEAIAEWFTAAAEWMREQG